MDKLLNDIDTALEMGLLDLSLIGAFSLIDICGALDSHNCKSTASKFIKWFERYLGAKYQLYGDNRFSGEDCYYLRCSLLHQYQTKHEKSNFQKIVFSAENSQIQGHRNIINSAEGKTLHLDRKIFAKDILESVRSFMCTSELYKINKLKVMQFQEKGVSPFKDIGIIVDVTQG